MTTEGAAPVPDQPPTVLDVAEGPKPTPSPAEILRAGYERAQTGRVPKDIVLHGYGEPHSELHLLFRALDDYAEVRSALRAPLTRRGVQPAQRELEAAMETLRLASVGSYALIGGERHEVGCKLGLELHDYLFPPAAAAESDVRPGNDRQAIFLLFHEDSMAIMTAYTELDRWIKAGGQEAEEETLGN